MPWWNKFPGQLARLILVIHIIRYKSGETKNIEIDYESVEMGHKLGKYFLSHAYKTVRNRNDKNKNPDYIPYQKEYKKIVKWVKTHKIPMDIRTMIAYRCFKNKTEAQGVLDELVEYGLGIFVNEEKKLFVPLGFKE